MNRKSSVFLLLMCMLAIILVASASATDLNESNIYVGHDNVEDVIEIIEDNEDISISDENVELGVSQDSKVLGDSYIPENFSDIQTCIDKASDGDTITLIGTYVVGSSDNPINVNKQLNFIGKRDAIIDGNSNLRLFEVNCNGVLFKDITFKNGNSDRFGGAIYTKYSTSVENCFFINNSAARDGGAMYGGTANNCTFINNFAKNQNGGAMYGGSSINCTFINNSANNGGATFDGSSINCTFINNSATYGGGAIYGSSAVNCRFVNNSANQGGAISDGGDDCNIVNCSFLFNSAKNRGGAFYFTGGYSRHGIVANCSFVNNSANSAGAIFIDSSCENIVNCSFVNNSARDDSGAIKFRVWGSATNCSFINNTAENNYGAVYASSASVVNCTFVNNSANRQSGAMYGSPIDCIFIGNSAGTNGGAIVGGGGQSASNCIFINNSAASGGAIYSVSSVINCIFIGNSADQGGAFYRCPKSCINCTFTNNFANGDGGAIYNAVSSANIAGCIFTDNSAGGTGGAIYTESIINGCIFINNSANVSASDVYLHNSYKLINNSQFINCSSSDAIILLNCYDVTINNCTFSNCSSNNSGYIIYLKDRNNLILSNCNITNCNFGEDNNYFGFYSDSANYTVLDCIFDKPQSGLICYYNSLLNVVDLSIAKGEKGIILVNLSDVRGSLFNKTITFTVNGNNYTNITDFNGLTTFEVTNYICESGVYIISISFNGDDIDLPVSTNVTFIIRYDSILNTNDLSLVLGNDGYIITNISDIRGLLSNKTIVFTLNENNYTNISNDFGIASINVKDILTESGIYTVNVNFLGDTVNNPISVNSTVIIRYDSYVSVNDLSIVLGDDGVILANLYDSRGPLVNKDIIFTINGNNYTKTTDSMGVARINVKGILTESGIYPVTISYAGDNVTNPVSNTTIVIVRYDSVLSVNDLSIFVGDDGILTVNLFDSRGSVAGKNVTYAIGGHEYVKSTDDNGQFSINVKDYLSESGIYDVYFNFLGDNVNNPVSANSTVILRYDSYVSVNDLSIVLGDDGILIVNLSDSRGSLANRDIVFTINGNNYTKTTDSEGVAKINVNGILIESGIYPVTISYAGDNVTNPVSNDTMVIVRFDSNLKSSNLEVFITEDGILTANLSDSRGPLVNKNIIFTINGNTCINTTDSSGLTSINVKNFLTVAGPYTVYLNFEGDIYDNPTSTSANVIINKYDSIITANNLSVVQGKDAILTARLSDQRGAISNKLITFNINGKKRTGTTDSQGVVSINVKDDLTDVDEYSVNISFAGDGYDKEASTNANVIIKYESILNVNDLSVKLGNDGIIIANLSTKDNQQTNKNIKFKINNVFYSNTTDSDGIAKFNVKNYLTKSGIYTILVGFDGDKFNDPVSASSNVIIRYDSTLQVDDISVYITQDALLNAKLYDSRGLLKNKEIIFTINGDSNRVTTNSNGIATLNVKNYLTKSMTYTFGVSFEGDNENNPVSTNVNVVVNKYDSSINVQGISVYMGTDGILSATLSDSRGALANKVLTFTVKGIDYTNVTNSNGIAKFNVKNYLTQANTYPVTVSFAGDDYDKSTSTNVNVVIKKYSPSLTVNSLSIHKGEDGIINAKLSDSRGVLSNKQISFTINGNKYFNTTNSEGIASINIKNYLTESGSYTVGVSFAGDDWDNSVSRNSNVMIRYDSVLNADNVSMSLSEDGSLIASLFDVRGALSGKKLTFTVNNIKRTINTNAYGLAALPINGLLTSSGEYIVNIAFEGDNYNNPISTNASVIVRYDVNLDVGEVYIYKGEESNLSVALSDARGILANKNVTFNINNENHTILTDSEGIALIKVTDYLSSLGTHTIGIGFAGDSYDNPLSVNTNVIIRQYDTLLNVNNLSIVLGNDGILTANLSNIRSSLKYKYVSFTIGMTKVTKTTDSDGIATFNVKSYFTELGDYTVGVSFEGDEFNKPVSVDAHVRINTYVGNLTITQNGKYYEDTVLEIKLVDAYNNQPKVGVVKLVFSNNVTYSAQTDANGIIRYDCNQFKPGSYNVSATVSDLYADINVADLNFTILGLVGAINITKVDYSKTLKIKLYNPENGDVYRNVKVDLQFSGQNDMHDTATTNNEGVATYNMPFTPGIYSVIATVNGEYKQFEPSELKNIVISDKDTTKVSFDPGEIIFDYGSSGFTTVTVVGGSVDVANISVVGQNASISLDAYNKITVSGLDAGNYKLCVITTPDSAHDSVIAMCNITVNKIYSMVDFDNNIAFDYLESGSTTVNVMGGSIGNVTIDGNPQDAIINLTDNTIAVSGLNAGTYTLRVTSIPDKNHKSVAGTAHVTVRKIDSEVNVNDVTFNYAQSGSTTVIVNGGIVEYRNIKVIGQPLANISFANNMITVSNLNVGTYTLSVTSTPDANHYASTGTAVITVNKIDSKVTLINPIEFDYGGSDFTSVYSEGCSISKENISVLDESGNKVDAKITYENNVISVSNLAAGIYKLIVISTPDANHKSVSASRNITVNKVASEIKSYTSIVFNYLATGSTYITVDGGSLSTEKMEIAGHKEARISYVNNQIMVSNLDPGKYTLKVTSVPDVNHYADVKFIEVTVNKAPLKIQPSSVRSFQINKGVWKIKVLDSANRPIGNLEVTLKVYTGNKFKTVTVVTDRNGEATYKIRGLSKGTHKVVLSVSHKGYASKDVTSSLKIIKPKVLKFKVKKRDNSKKGSLITFQILDKKTKRGVNGVKVKLMIYTGKKYKAFILKSKKVGKFKGIVGVFTNEFSVGKHKVVVKPISLKYSGSGKSTITIKKSAKKYSKKTTKA